VCVFSFQKHIFVDWNSIPYKFSRLPPTKENDSHHPKNHKNPTPSQLPSGGFGADLIWIQMPPQRRAQLSRFLAEGGKANAHGFPWVVGWAGCSEKKGGWENCWNF